jgi:hypothetical protein
VYAAIEVVAVTALRATFAEAVAIAIFASGLARFLCGDALASIHACANDEHRNRQDKERFHRNGYSTG